MDGIIKKPKYVSAGATISECGLYRYNLHREWRGTHNPDHWHWIREGDGVPLACLFIMLNPSTADGDKDDPTIRRCVSFAKRWRYERIEVVNLFAFRATKPADLFALYHRGTVDHDPVGPENQSYVQNAANQAGKIICAWGASGGWLGQDQVMLEWIKHADKRALGLTTFGQPRHPLYVPGDAKIIKFDGAK